MIRYCDVEGCEKRHYGRGFCAVHYQRFRKHGDPMGSAYAPKPACSVDGCEVISYKKGMCNPHYIRNRRHGDPHAMKYQRKPSPDATCTADQCKRPWLARGLCKLHYDRKYGKPHGEPQVRKPCAVDKCDGMSKAYGYCDKHARRLKLYGDPLGTPPEYVPYACGVDGCTAPSYALDLCGSHYWIQTKYGDPLAVPQRNKKKHAERPPMQCVTCGEWFNPGTSHLRKYCSRACRPKRKTNTYAGRETVLRMASRDGWACMLCGGEIDSSYYHPHPLSGSVDHILPTSKGGTDEPDNTQLAHLRCNISKGNRV